MKNSTYSKYIYWAITVLSVVACSILFFFVLFKLDAFGRLCSQILGIFKPFIYGLAMAYLLIPIFNFCYKKLEPILKRKVHKELRAKRIAKALSTTISMLFALILVSGLISMVLPQLVVSIVGLVDTMPSNIRNMTVWLQNIFANYPELEAPAMQLYEEGIIALTNWIKIDMLPQLTSVVNGLWGTITFIKDVFVGLFVCIYILNSKELFCAQAKKLTYSCFALSKANLIIDNLRFVHRVFGGFINGKLLDSLIIGIICFVGMTMLQLPYAMLISVVIGVTNVIPFFGPFIGAIPSALLLLLVSPMQTLYFLLFVLVLQQFDGNVLGPKILGNSTGLSSFWVLFAILIFGGFFGFTGMVVGVPFFAVLYSLVSGLVNRSLRRKALSENTHDYFDLDHIDKDLSMSYEKGAPSVAIKTSSKDGAEE